MLELSIIVPIYNCDKYLEECIESIINQTFKNFELILVDDGSTDNSGSICDFYKDKDKRVRVIHKKNGGVSSSRNVGINLAIGKYVGFVDSDDIINRNMYKIMLEAINKEDADICQCKYEYFWNEDIDLNEEKENYNYTVLSNIEAIDNNFKYDDNQNTAITVLWNKIYKRDLFENLMFPNGRIHEDEYITYKIIYKARKMIFLDEKVYFYRQHPESIVHQKFSIKNFNVLIALKERIYFLDLNGEEELKKKAICSYENELSKFHRLCRDFQNSSIIRKKIRIEHRKYCFKVLFNKYASNKLRVATIVFCLFPCLYDKYKIDKEKKLLSIN